MLYGYIGWCNTQQPTDPLIITGKIAMHNGADEYDGTLCITNNSGAMITYQHFGYCSVDLSDIPNDDSITLVQVTNNTIECNAFQYSHNERYYYYILDDVESEWVNLSDTDYHLVGGINDTDTGFESPITDDEVDPG
jgi:hypothetical protein